MVRNSRADKSAGFTIIELMIVIAIISILLVIGVPIYQQYSVRAKVAEGLSLANPVLLSVAEYYQTNNRGPSSNPQAGVPPPGDYATDFVTSIEVGVPNDGDVTITLNSANLPELGGNNTLILRPIFGTENVVSWTCETGEDTLPDWARPGRCR